jgi:hypothetical protein
LELKLVEKERDNRVLSQRGVEGKKRKIKKTRFTKE